MEQIIGGLHAFLAWPGPAYMLLGCLLGIVFGFLPGLGGPQVLALLTPVTYGMEPNLAISMLIGAMGAVPFGGSISAILLNTPGTAQNAATCLDGFPLTQQGRGAYALGASAFSSILGSVFGALVLTFLLPFGRAAVLAFSYPEYFMMAMLGISVIAAVSEGSLWKGLVAGLFGLLLTSIGYDPVTGSIRFTFGIEYLYDGIKIVPALIGLFAVSQALDLMLKGQFLTEGGTLASTGAGVLQGAAQTFRHFWLFLRCCVLGVIIGVIPGVGGSVANWMAYLHAAKSERKNPIFGRGDIRGVIAPQSADTAKDGGALVPTIIFGVPGSVETAVLLAALVLHGIQPGPLLMLEHPSVIYVMIYALVFSNITAGVLGLLGARYLTRLTTLPVHILAPVIFVLSVMGAYATDGVFGDVIVALVFGVLGFFMMRFHFSRVAMVIALVLGGLAQRSFHQTLVSMGAKGFFDRPISLALFILILMMLASPLLRRKSKKGKIAS
jgi:putative tricarboxylic transport membrane protein